MMPRLQFNSCVALSYCNRHPILRKSIEILSSIINVTTDLSHPLDEARAKELLKALHKQSILLKYDDVYSLAIENNWSERNVQSIATLAEKVGNGGRVQIKHPRNWGEPTVKKIISELSDT